LAGQLAHLVRSRVAGRLRPGERLALVLQQRAALAADERFEQGGVGGCNHGRTSVPAWATCLPGGASLNRSTPRSLPPTGGFHRLPTTRSTTAGSGAYGPDPPGAVSGGDGRPSTSSSVVSRIITFITLM